jgi:hypothetical protein
LNGTLYICFFGAIAFLNIACGSKEVVKADYSHRSVTPDSIFTAKFYPRGDGFTGGDATYSVELPDGRTVWIFGDTFVGNVTNDNRRMQTSPSYIRNSFVLFVDGDLQTLQQGEPSEFKSMMIPPEVSDGTSGLSELQLWYWPGDAFVENDKLNVFVSKFFQEDHSDMWSFEFKGTELVEFSLPDLKPQNVHRFDKLDSVHYGHAVYEDSAYTYIYGLRKQKAYVARAIKGQVLGPWQFYDGTDWVMDARKAAPMMNELGSEQFSITRHDDTYVLIMQDTDLGRKIFSQTSATPYGPWKNRKVIYETPIPENCENCWTYNALAHPQFTMDGLLLVSYNTNSMKMEDHYENALIYRPRFIRIPLEMIMSQ